MDTAAHSMPAMRATIDPIDVAALLLRLALGAMWLSHAIVRKVMTFGMAGLAQWMGTVGVPAVLAYPLVIAETVGGLAILLGDGRYALRPERR